MSLFRMLSRKQCVDEIPIRQSIGSGIVIIHRCILDKGHPGLHQDKHGNRWVNQAALMRERGMG